MSNGRQSQGRLPSTQLPSDYNFHQNENDRPLSAPKTHNNVPNQSYVTPPGFAPQTSLKPDTISTMQGQQATPYSQGREQDTGTFSMSGLGESLPDYMHPQDEVERRASGSSATLHQQSPSPFAGQTPMTNPGYGMYAPQYATPYQQAAANAQAFSLSQLNQQSQGPGSNPMHQQYPGHAYYPGQQPQQYILYPGQYGQAGQSHQGIPATFAHSYGRGSNPAFGGGPPQQISDLTAIPGRVSQYGGFSAGGPLNYGYGPGAPFSRPGVTQGDYTYQTDQRGLKLIQPYYETGSRGSAASKPTPGPIPSSPRGPPRKPKQSGHALWVGNLPSGTRIIDLKDHFSREATKTIESVFLISKSNCAFVNYRSDETCASAMTRFHDSRFHGVRLVCRLRKTTAGPGTGIPTGPASLLSTIAPSQSAIESIRQNREVSSRAEAMAQEEGKEPGQALPTGSDKFFIMKSLTVEDMELSVRNNIWATQAHNEEALNKAFETAENVYLIFSANKSGEYFGYARMASSITEEVAASLDWAPKPDTIINDPELPRAIPTPATEWAPKGHIIDDSARGTIFWEADPVDDPVDSGEADKAEDADHPDTAEEIDEPSGAQAFGKPFKIEWLTTNRLPFYRTRGLRNPWNANREVKIARDGTELETSVGRRLLQMFHRATNEPAPIQGGWPTAR